MIGIVAGEHLRTQGVGEVVRGARQAHVRDKGPAFRLPSPGTWELLHGLYVHRYAHIHTHTHTYTYSYICPALLVSAPGT